MTTLRLVLDEVLDLLQHPEFKTFGALQKHRYQMSKPAEDKEIRSIMYSGGLGNSEEAKARSRETRKNNPKNKESNKKAALNRAAWYKNPENRKKFEEQIKVRDRRNREKKQQKLQGNKS